MSESFVPPAGVASAAKRALGWISEGHAGGGFTDTGRARASQLAARDGVSAETINRMVSFFARHEVDKKAEGFNQGEKGFPSPGRVAWDAWGGDAGKSWAESIAARLNKEKAPMANDFATSYAEIFKYDKNDDGTLTVYGKATSDDLDIDQQICDNDWLKRAMPEWFKSGGNIREQHSSIAAGVATEYEEKGDGFYVTAKVVDKNSILKVEHKVLKGFSIGIKGPRVVRDNKAANGRIIDGQIVELSLVDRPANPTCQLVLAKSVGNDSTLTQVEELIEKYSDSQERDAHGRFGSGGGGESSRVGQIAAARDHAQAKAEEYKNSNKEVAKNMRAAARALDKAHEAESNGRSGSTHIQEAHQQALYAQSSSPRDENGKLDTSLTEKTGPLAIADSGTYGAKTITPTKETPVAKSVLAETILELVKSANGETVKFDQASYDTARRALAQLIITEAGEMADGSDERDDIEELIEAIKHLFRWKDGEDEEGETNMSGSTIEMAAAKAADGSADCTCDGCKACKAAGGCKSTPCAKCAMDKGAMKDSADCDCDGCAACAKDGGCDKSPCMKCMMAKSASIGKCLECGCGMPGQDHGKTTVQIPGNNAGIATTANVSTATIMTPEQNAGSIKSAEGEEPAEVAAEEAAPTEVLNDEVVTEIVEKAVKTATESVRAEIESLKSATKAAEEKAVALESELVAAKSAAAAGGPKRTGRIAVTQTNELMLKAAEYRAKAAATSDPILVKGYKALEKEFLSKAGKSDDQD